MDRRAKADAEAAEAAALAHPEATMRRRDFLARTAALAGAAGLAGALPAESLISAAARVQGRRPLPSPRNMPIDTVVVLMMENRSYDHYFGWYDQGDGRNTGLTYPAPGGRQVPTYRLTPDFQGCGHPDPDHGWDGGRYQWNGGRNDRFVFGNAAGTGSDEFAVGYYLEEDLGFIAPAAKAYTLYDRWFCSIMASTYPNRHYQVAAQNGGQKSNFLPPETEERLGFQWETIFDRALSHGVSIGYYVSDLPFPGLYGERGFRWVRPVAQFYEDAAQGTLPNITFVDPPFRDGGGGDGTSADEHPHGDIRLGQAFMSDIAHAFMASPQYRRGVMFINYDEWGGFFDHVSPPRVPDDRANLANLAEDWSLMGFRVPSVAISPFTRGGRVSHPTMGHEAILKLISYRFGLGHLNKRHRYSYNVGRTLDFERPDYDPPQLPDPNKIVSIPCRLGGEPGSRGTRPKQHDLVLLESSGLLDRLGYEVRPATYDQIFREPDGIRKGLSGG
jgi:phospholipase C